MFDMKIIAFMNAQSSSNIQTSYELDALIKENDSV